MRPDRRAEGGRGLLSGPILALAALLTAFPIASAAAPAAGQLRVIGQIASDDRYRGRSVSEGRPVASLDLAYDAPSGLYAGLAGTGVASRQSGPAALSLQLYGGYVARLSNAAALDLGVSHSRYTREYSGEARGRYTEVYAGLVARRFATHLYYSPNYFSSGRRTLYAEIDSSLAPTRSWRINGHAGLLSVLNGPRAPGWRRQQFDWRIGLAKAIGGVDLELAVSGAGPNADYYAGRTRGHAGLVASLTHLF